MANIVNVNTPLAFWKALQTDAGLELKRKKGVPGRDADLETSLVALLATQIGIPPAASVEAALKADAAQTTPVITVESFVETVLSTLQDFSAMMGDILQTLEMASAVNPENALGIAFSFDRTSAPLKFSLESFRAQVEKVRTVSVMQRVLPNGNLRWELLEAARSVVDIMALPDTPFPPLAQPAPPPASGDPDVDALLLELGRVVDAFCSRLLGYGNHPDRYRLFEAVNAALAGTDDDTRRTTIKMAADATDGWDFYLVDAMQKIAYGVKSGSTAPADVASALTPVLNQLPGLPQQIQEKYRELVDMLNLPVWKKRHELYSVWVGTALLRVAKNHADRFEFLPADGELSFAFGGSRLATYCSDGKQFDIWAEFRSALKGTSKKRTKGIQPDFRVMQVALGGTDNAKTRFVLECKHYLKPSLSNFTQAADDYARSCVNADVFVVNHGPADHDLLVALLNANQQTRVRFLGEMTAAGNTTTLEQAIRATLFPPTATAASSTPTTAQPLAPSVGTIRLAWDGSLQDMDLSVIAKDAAGNTLQTIDYSMQGDLRAAPFLYLQCDVQKGPGAENIDIAQWHYPRYDIVATKYSTAGTMQHGHLKCTVRLGHDFRIIDFPAGGDPYAPWQVATIIVANGVPRLQLPTAHASP
ncbi:hypothetical protein [Burkholderia lata]|uniref:hypothetical protein n=1 Tax=Burkholderia lata (strain ATCC 17760 / DSM 23089 / LMG 22485 / NCIMB 9086 / R18194 / 383) TaxID=482957 RepID=UPI0014543DC9|nr:hypothetical protein [Burkholderia lata]VWM13936.1 hypothetical protein BLA6992_05039 [Burkholderia lata]